MKKTHYLIATVQEGNCLDISLPNLPVGETVEVILIVSETESNNIIDRQSFLQLSLEERRCILAEQAETRQGHYETDSEWKDWVNLDSGNIYDYDS